MDGEEIVREGELCMENCGLDAGIGPQDWVELGFRVIEAAFSLAIVCTDSEGI